jgi:hypothetical protein
LIHGARVGLNVLQCVSKYKAVVTIVAHYDLIANTDNPVLGLPRAVGGTLYFCAVMINSSIPGAVLDASIGGNLKPFGGPISMQLLFRCHTLFLLTVDDFEFACIEFV